ncbi:MAG: hypothetical protein AAF928_06905 [Myxococcota bacterium]
MSGDVALAELLAMMRRDGMRVQTFDVPTPAVVVVKSVLEAYPGLASVHAAAGRAPGEHTRLFVASSPAVADEVAEICRDDLAAWGVVAAPAAPASRDAAKAVEGPSPESGA